MDTSDTMLNNSKNFQTKKVLKLALIAIITDKRKSKLETTDKLYKKANDPMSYHVNGWLKVTKM